MIKAVISSALLTVVLFTGNFVNTTCCFLHPPYDMSDPKGEDAGSCGKTFVTPSSDNATDKNSTMVLYIHKPVCPGSLGIVRCLFGLMMVIDIPNERGLHNIDERFGDPMACHFPLFHWWTPLQFQYMGLVYFVMWAGSLGMCAGYKFKTSCLLFALPYWYLFLLDKTAWNNHSYLYGLLSVMFFFTDANHYFSLDAWLNPAISGKAVPIWNYWIIRFQFFLMYFYAGLKKTDPDWIGGYSMSALGDHWVFLPFSILLSAEQIEKWVIHVFGFLFDLTVGFFLLWEKSRPVAILFSSAFHLMNSQMFHIGQFPYVCLVTTPIFCSYSWPLKYLSGFRLKGKEPFECKKKCEDPDQTISSLETKKPTLKQKLTFSCLSFYVALQLLLPYSHSFTPGYNNWTNGLYGYSWDMMVHSWDTTLVTITVQDNVTGRRHYLDPNAWVRNNRYSKHADMAVQYAACIKRNLASLAQQRRLNELQDVSIFMDAWCSLNKRFQQRIFDPRQDLLTAEWSPFQKTTWLLPLLTELTPWREKMAALRSEVYNWSNTTDCFFIADYPGISLEHFVRRDIHNVTLTVLRGTVSVNSRRRKTTLQSGEHLEVDSGHFHTLETLHSEPSCVLYTYQNHTVVQGTKEVAPKISSVTIRYTQLLQSLQNLRRSFYKIAADIGVAS